MPKNFLKFLIALSLLSIILNQATTQIPQNTATISDPNQTQIKNNNNTNNNAEIGDKSTNIYSSIPTPSESLKEITNSEFKTNIYPVVNKFPVDEQNVIANCYKTNTDPTRYIDPDCYKNSFSSVKSAVGKAFGENLTDYSKQLRGGLACLSKISQTYGSTTDATSNLIQTSISSIISQQANLNQCSAKFIKGYLELLNLRKRYLLTTKVKISEAALKDSTSAEINNFVFTTAERSEFVSSFKTYCLCLYKFFNNLNTDVSSIQTLVGSLEKCKLAPTNNNNITNNSTSISNPNSTSTQNSQAKPSTLRSLQTTTGTNTSSNTITAPKCCSAALTNDCFACNTMGNFCCSALYKRTDCLKCENFDFNTGKFLNSASATPTSTTMSPTSTPAVAPTPAVIPGSSTYNSSSQCCLTSSSTGCLVCNAAKQPCCTNSYTKADCFKCEFSIPNPISPTTPTMNTGIINQNTVNPSPPSTSAAAAGTVSPPTSIQSPPNSGSISTSNFDISKAQCCEFNKFIPNCLECNAEKKFCCSAIYARADCAKCNSTTGFVGTGASAGSIPSPTTNPSPCCDANKSIPNCVQCPIAPQPINFTYTCCVKDKLIENCFGCDSSGKVDFAKCCSDTNKSSECLKCPAANSTIGTAVPISAPIGTALQPCCNANIKTNCVECKADSGAANGSAQNAESNADKNSNLPCCSVSFITTTSCKKCENANFIPQKLPECTEQNKNLGPCLTKINSEVAQAVLQNIGKNINAASNALNSNYGGKGMFVIPENVLKSASEVKELLNAKANAIPDFNLLASKINTDLTSTSGFMPKNALHRLVLDVVKAQNLVDFKKEFEKPIWSTKCDADYIFWCTEGQCKCSGAGCPKEIPTPVTLFNSYFSNGNNNNNSASNQAANPNPKLNRILQTTSIGSALDSNGNVAGTLTGSQAIGNVNNINNNNNNNNGSNNVSNTNNQIPILNSGNSVDSLNYFFLCSSCVNSRRVLFSEAIYSLTGKHIDFYDSASQSNISTQVIQQQTVCNNIFAAGTKEEKSKCRGQMNDSCSDSLDNSCSQTGLYNILIANPPTNSAYPSDCDESNLNYSEEKCLSWINEKLLINSIGLNLKSVINLPFLIQASQKTSALNSNGNLRYLQNSSSGNIKVVSVDPVAADTKAIISASLASLTDGQLTIDSATATQVPNTSVYVQEVNQVVQSFSRAEGLFGLRSFICLFALLIIAVLS